MDNFLIELEAKMPPRQTISLRTEPDIYGMSKIVSRSLNLPFTPYSFSNLAHGWFHADIKYIEQFGIINDYKYLVATKEHERFFKKNNKKSYAVGMPYCYAAQYDKKRIARIQNSLLVMPPHGLDSSNESWNEKTYVKQISELKQDFDYVVACIHHSCVTKGNWVNEFKKHDIPFIIGAQMDDRNALIRMHRLFSAFEYMTTNIMGSHVVYASYSGCKVSIYGDYAEWKHEDLKEDVLFIEYPFVFDHVIHCSSKAYVQEKFNYLLANPKDAKDRIEWAKKELGYENIKSYLYLAWLFGWMPHQQLYFWSIKIFLKIKKTIVSFL